MDQDSMQRAEWEHLDASAKLVITDDDVEVIAAYQGESPYEVARQITVRHEDGKKDVPPYILVEREVPNEKSESISHFLSGIGIALCVVGLVAVIVLNCVN